MNIVLIIIGVILVLFSLIIIWRNNYVLYYRIELNHRCKIICLTYAHSRSYRSSYFENVMLPMWDSIHAVSYYKMVFMFWRPLKDKYWLTKEQRDFLNLKFET